MTVVDQTPFINENHRISDASIIKSLGHPIRLKILVTLDMQKCTVKNIWECLGLQQSIVSQHLAILKKHGIIDGKRKGVEMHYSIVDPLARRIITALLQS